MQARSSGGEHLLDVQRVGSSNLPAPTIYRDSSVREALASLTFLKISSMHPATRGTSMPVNKNLDDSRP